MSERIATITELTTFNEQTLAELDALMHELSPSSNCAQERLRDVLADSNAHLYVVKETGRIVGCATLCVANTPEFKLGFVEAVVVLKECRGKGYGKQLMAALQECANQHGVQHLHLTSNPARKAANALYQSMGFEQYNTNCYVMTLK